MQHFAMQTRSVGTNGRERPASRCRTQQARPGALEAQQPASRGRAMTGSRQRAQQRGDTRTEGFVKGRGEAIPVSGGLWTVWGGLAEAAPFRRPTRALVSLGARRLTLVARQLHLARNSPAELRLGIQVAGSLHCPRSLGRRRATRCAARLCCAPVLRACTARYSPVAGFLGCGPARRAMAATSAKPYLAAVRTALTNAMCIRNLPCQLARSSSQGCL